MSHIVSFAKLCHFTDAGLGYGLAYKTREQTKPDKSDADFFFLHQKVIVHIILGFKNHLVFILVPNGFDINKFKL